MADVKQPPKNISALSQWKKTCLQRRRGKTFCTKYTKARKQERKQQCSGKPPRQWQPQGTKCHSTKSDNLGADSPHNKRKTHTSHRRPALLWRGGTARGSNVGHMWKLVGIKKKKFSRLTTVEDILLCRYINRTGGVFPVASCGIAE